MKSDQKPRLKSAWTRHINDQATRTKFETTVLVGLKDPVAVRLIELLVEMRESNTRRRTSDYSSPSWAFEQAHYNGYEQALKEVLALMHTSHTSTKD